MNIEKKCAFEAVQAEGSHYEIGFKLGTRCRDLAVNMVSAAQEKFKASGVSLEKVRVHVQKYFPYAVEFYPEFVEEIRGYADGAKLEFQDVFALFLLEHLGGVAKGCTDIAASNDVTADGSVYAAHNEDWFLEQEKNIVLVRIKPRDEPDFLAITYGGILISCGVNSAGISLTGNALTPTDIRIGVPKDFAVRKVLASKTIGDAIKAAVPEKRASSYNNIICDLNGEIYSMEGSATDFDALYARRGFLVHTNHYISPRMIKYDGAFQTKHDRSPLYANSIIRYNRALRLFQKELGQVTIDSFKKILVDHVNYPLSICRHVDDKLPPNEQTKTVFSVVIDVTRMTMWVCRGNPCLGEYKEYKLK